MVLEWLGQIQGIYHDGHYGAFCYHIHLPLWTVLHVSDFIEVLQVPFGREGSQVAPGEPAQVIFCSHSAQVATASPLTHPPIHPQTVPPTFHDLN